MCTHAGAKARTLASMHAHEGMLVLFVDNDACFDSQVRRACACVCGGRGPRPPPPPPRLGSFWVSRRPFRASGTRGCAGSSSQSGLSTTIRAVIHALHSSKETHFEFQGAVVAMVLVNSAIRQGCPLSGTLLALVADPFVKWFQAQAILLGACIFLSAVAVAIVVANILRVLDALPYRLRRWAFANGLALNGPRCVSMPLWNGGHEVLLPRVDGLECFRGAAVQSSARCLGV